MYGPATTLRGLVRAAVRGVTSALFHGVRWQRHRFASSPLPGGLVPPPATPAWSITLALLAALVAVCLATASALAQQATQPARPRVIVVPVQGVFRYRMAVSEIAKVARAARVQKPEAIVFVVSSPGGRIDIAFELAEQIADMPAGKVVALVSGDYGGAFEHAALPLLACDRVFVAPDNAIDLQPAALAGESNNDDATRLTARQVSLLQTWAAERHLPWSPIKNWLQAARLLEAPAETASKHNSPAAPANPAVPPAASLAAAEQAGARQTSAEQPATAPARLSGIRPLQAEPAANLDEVLAKLDLAGAWVIHWPDPVAKSNSEMQRMFQVADDLVKQANGAIGLARESDPRAHRYELRDVSRQYTMGTIIIATQPSSDLSQVLQQTDTVTDRDLFADGGEAWRANTDRCIAHVRKAIGANRNLARLAALYPELNLDPAELNESHQTLTNWLSQLRAERNLRSPP